MNRGLSIIETLAEKALFLLVNLAIAVSYPRQFYRYSRLSLPHGRVPNPAFPKSANDKFFWRKVFDRDPRFPVVSDKIAVKQWIEDTGFGIKYARLLWTGTDATEIPPSLFDRKVVVKANHAAAMNIFVEDDEIDRARIARRANWFLKFDHGRPGAEWGYFSIPRTLLVEEGIDGLGPQLIELNIYTFGTRATLIVQYEEKTGPERVNFWIVGENDRLTASDLRYGDPCPESDEPPVANMDQALAIARLLGSKFDHVRVDLVSNQRDIWFCELSLYSNTGLIADTGHDPESEESRAWDIRRSWFFTGPDKGGLTGLYARTLKRALDREEASQNK